MVFVVKWCKYFSLDPLRRICEKLGMRKARKSYPRDVSDEEWAFCAPYLTLMKEDAPQRDHSLRELFNGLRWFVGQAVRGG